MYLLYRCTSMPWVPSSDTWEVKAGLEMLLVELVLFMVAELRWALLEAREDRSWVQNPLPNLKSGLKLGRQAPTIATAASRQVHIAVGAW